MKTLTRVWTRERLWIKWRYINLAFTKTRCQTCAYSWSVTKGKEGVGMDVLGRSTADPPLRKIALRIVEVLGQTKQQVVIETDMCLQRTGNSNTSEQTHPNTVFKTLSNNNYWCPCPLLSSIVNNFIIIFVMVVDVCTMYDFLVSVRARRSISVQKAGALAWAVKLSKFMRIYEFLLYNLL